MRRPTYLLSAVLLIAFAFSAVAPSVRADESGKLMHNVFFTLKDSTEENRAKLVAACKTLEPIPGIEYFAVGTLSEDLESPVNVRDFDVSLTVLFEDKKAHDVYQTHEVHVKFVDENRPTFKKVRVFDTYLE